MAVYTHLSAEDLAELVAHYEVGTLRSAKGIAEGVSNSNWLIETADVDGDATGRYILTMYERRIALDDLPFFLGLLDHLSDAGAPVPRTIHDRDGALWRMWGDKAVALIEYLPGISVGKPSADQARAVGAALAEIHLAAQDFGQQRANALDLDANIATLDRCGPGPLAAIDPALASIAVRGRALAEAWPGDLPRSVIHSDLFPDNVLMLGDRVTGLIDFYFACTGAMALDLATTHAAWCFDESNAYRPDLGSAMVEGYESIRPLEPAERALLPAIAKGAALRFVASRAEDWLDTPDDALVTRKDPMQFVARWHVYDELGEKAFATR